MKIYLVRHCSTNLNEKGCLRSWLDIPLSKMGIKEAGVLKKYFSGIKIDSVYSSDFDRASTTAKIVADDHSLKVEETKDLRPIDFGDLNGQPYEAIRTKLKALFKIWQVIPTFKAKGGESFNDFQERIYPFTKKLFQNKNTTIIIVSHARACLYILALAMNNMRKLKGLDLEMLDSADIGVGNIATLKYEDDRLVIDGLNLIRTPGEEILDNDAGHKGS